MSEYFYVLGLPRSRTLWLSFLLSDDESMCYHEGLTTHGSKQLPETGHKYIGSVDTNPLVEVERNGRVAIIKRDAEDVKQSIKDWFSASSMSKADFDSLVNLYIDKYQKALESKKYFTVNYDDLNLPEKVLELIDYLKPEHKTTLNHVKFMQSCIIKTKNKDLTNSLNHTALYSGRSVDELHKDKITITRTLNVAECLEVISNPDIYKTISEDTGSLEASVPNVVDDYWLSLKLNGDLIGVCRIHQKYALTCQGHIQILPKYRIHSLKCGYLILDWIKNNTIYKTIITEVPIIYPNVIDYLKIYNFRETGTIPNSYLKDNEMIDVKIFTRSI